MEVMYLQCNLFYINSFSFSFERTLDDGLQQESEEEVLVQHNHTTVNL